MQDATHAASVQFAAKTGQLSRGRVWTGRIISGLVVLFLLFDAVTKIAKEPHVIAASAQMGYSAGTIVGIGALLLACTVIYVIPRTAPLGAILLTGYLGGAVLANVHAGHGAFENVFPAAFGVLVWVGLVLRDDRLRVLIAPRD